AKKRAMKENRDDLLAGNTERPGVRRMQMGDAHGVWPVAVDLRVDAPFERNQSARMPDDGAIDVEDKDILRPPHGLFGARAGTDEHTAGSRHTDRDVAEHSDRALVA